MTDDPNRNPDGTFSKGNTVGGHTQRGRTTRAKRIEQIDEKYDTVEKLLALFDIGQDGQLSPNAELKAMHPRDAALIMQAMGAIYGDDKRGERESFWDREEGKPKDIKQLQNPDGSSIASGFVVQVVGVANDASQDTSDTHPDLPRRS